MAYDKNHTEYHPFICLLLESFRCITNSYLTLSSSSMRALSLHAYLNTPEDIHVFHARLATPRPVMIHRDSSHGCIRQYIDQLVLFQKRCEVITSKKPLFVVHACSVNFVAWRIALLVTLQRKLNCYLIFQSF